MPVEMERIMYLSLLERWVGSIRPDLYTCPDRPELVCYGSGENGWGVQTNQKAFAALAALAADPNFSAVRAGIAREELKELALGLLRFSLQSHIEGDYRCTDGKSWGHTWISALGTERMMHGVEALESELTDADRSLLRKVLLSECDWLLDHYEVAGGLYADSGLNRPESNLWNGALLHRVADLYPDADRAEQYREKGLVYLINSVSLPADERNETIKDGKTVAARFVGANFFESMALNHHGYLNVGYMAICLSNMAMLHFSYKRRGTAAPEALYHRMDELWELVKLCTFPDGRLLRIGGDTRMRYTYCQEYLVPVWLMVKDLLGDEECEHYEQGWLRQILREMDANGDGSFLSGRGEALKRMSPLYYTRLESDRAAALSMGLAWERLVGEGGSVGGEGAGASGGSSVDERGDVSEGGDVGEDGDVGECGCVGVRSGNVGVVGEGAGVSGGVVGDHVGGGGAAANAASGEQERAVAQGQKLKLAAIVQDSGGLSWHDSYHGAYLHRSERRIASWVWDAAEKPQGLILPADASDMAEWRENLSVRLSGIGRVTGQKLERHDGARFDGGFVTWGSLLVHTQGLLAEGQPDHPVARSRIACAALPDGKHMVVLQYAAALERRVYLQEVKGLHLLIPNDLFNGNHRHYYGGSGNLGVLQGVGSERETVETGSNWLNVDDRLGVVAVYGTDQLTICRPGRRQIGLKEQLVNADTEGMLYADELCGPCEVGLQSVDAGQVIVDAGYLLQADEAHAGTEAYARSAELASMMPLPDGAGMGTVRAVRVRGADGEIYIFAANFGESAATCRIAGAGGVELATGEAVAPSEPGRLALRQEPELERGLALGQEPGLERRLALRQELELEPGLALGQEPGLERGLALGQEPGLEPGLEPELMLELPPGEARLIRLTV